MPTDCAISEETVVQSDSAPASTPGSPKDKIKFLCSHGGKILPRPTDCHLKYVGGETRVISVPRDIKFQELMKKLTYQLEGEMVLKYQLVPEDLDALVSVKSDEDLRYMIDECDRSGAAAAASPRLRAFLFPAKPILLDPLNLSAEAIEQRYIDAINGIIRANSSSNNNNNSNNAVLGFTKPPATAAAAARSSLGQNHAVFSVSSGCSSPKSPDDDGVSSFGSVNGGGLLNERNRMHKVQSMPSFGSLNVQQQSISQYNTPAINEISPSYYQNYRQQNLNQRHGYQIGRPTMDHFRGVNRLISGRAMGSPNPYYNNNNYYPRQSRQAFGMMAQFDDFYERRSEKGARSSSQSPIPLSPRYGYAALRPLDGSMAAPDTPPF